MKLTDMPQFVKSMKKNTISETLQAAGKLAKEKSSLTKEAVAPEFAEMKLMGWSCTGEFEEVFDATYGYAHPPHSLYDEYGDLLLTVAACYTDPRRKMVLLVIAQWREEHGKPPKVYEFRTIENFKNKINAIWEKHLEHKGL